MIPKSEILKAAEGEEMKNAGDNLILGCEDSKCDEWPCVGDEVSLRYKFDSKQIMHTGKLRYLSGNHIIIETDKNSDYHCHRCDWSIEKPKTPEEELRDEVTEAVWKANDLWTNTKEVQQVSVQEFVTTKILDKYNITKKPQ